LGHAIGLNHDDHGLMTPILATADHVVAGHRTAIGAVANSELAAGGRELLVGGRPTAMDRASADSELDETYWIEKGSADEQEELIGSLVRQQHAEEVDEIFAQS